MNDVSPQGDLDRHGESRVPLEAVVTTDQLDERDSRSPDYEAENHALVSLMHELASPHGNVLQKLVETALSLCRAHSAGISILEEEEGRQIFRWHAVAGEWSVYLGGTMPRELSPCGTVLERNAPLLVSRPERHYLYASEITLPIVEALLIPFHVGGEPVGTIWVIAHDESLRFDREDLRVMSSLGEFASLAHQVLTAHHLKAQIAVREALDEQRMIELAATQRLQEISTRLIQAGDEATLYDHFLDAAIEIMHADFGSMQLLDPERGELRLLAHRGFGPAAAAFWEWVQPTSSSMCGVALRTGRRAIARDVETCEFMAGSDDLEMYRTTGIRASQTTPLFSRGGRLLGMISTHWRKPHKPLDRDLRLLDVLARQAADLMERARTEDERLELMNKLSEADRRKDEFLAILAHELRNPLAPIRTGLELIRLAGITPDSMERVRAMMDRQVSHMVRLIDDLLDVSRITSGKIELQRVPTPLTELVSHAIDANRAAMTAGRIQLTTSLPELLCVLDVDPTRFVQIVSNVLNNATKFTPPEGRIDVSAKVVSQGAPQKSELVLTISDTGAGISPELLPRVFELFSQGGRSSGRSQPGIGVGLALARRLIEMHGGRIEARSDGIGRGSAFIIRLPLTEYVPREAEHPPDSQTHDIQRRVVIIDDNEDSAEMLAMLVEALRGCAQVAHDGASGVRAVVEFRPDVILLDIGMPDIDGYETCRRIRGEAAGKDAFIIAVTGWGQEQDKRRALDTGFDAHLTKPVDLAALEHLLAGTKSRQ